MSLDCTNRLRRSLLLYKAALEGIEPVQPSYFERFKKKAYATPLFAGWRHTEEEKAAVREKIGELQAEKKQLQQTLDTDTSLKVREKRELRKKIDQINTDIHEQKLITGEKYTKTRKALLSGGALAVGTLAGYGYKKYNEPNTVPSDGGIPPAPPVLGQQVGEQQQAVQQPLVVVSGSQQMTVSPIASLSGRVPVPAVRWVKKPINFFVGYEKFVIGTSDGQVKEIDANIIGQMPLLQKIVQQKKSRGFQVEVNVELTESDLNAFITVVKGLMNREFDSQPGNGEEMFAQAAQVAEKLKNGELYRMCLFKYLPKDVQGKMAQEMFAPILSSVPGVGQKMFTLPVSKDDKYDKKRMQCCGNYSVLTKKNSENNKELVYFVLSGDKDIEEKSIFEAEKDICFALKTDCSGIFYYSNDDSYLDFYNFSTQKSDSIRDFEEGIGGVASIHVSSDNKIVLLQGQDKSIVLDIDTKISFDLPYVDCMFNPNDQSIVALNGNLLEVYDYGGNRLRQIEIVNPQYPSSFYLFGISPKISRVIIYSYFNAGGPSGQYFYIVDLNDISVLKYDDTRGEIRRPEWPVCFSPDGSCMVLGTEKRFFSVVNFITGEIKYYEIDNDRVRLCNFTVDGKYLSVCTKDKIYEFSIGRDNEVSLLHKNSIAGFIDQGNIFGMCGDAIVCLQDKMTSLISEGGRLKKQGESLRESSKILRSRFSFVDEGIMGALLPGWKERQKERLHKEREAKLTKGEAKIREGEAKIEEGKKAGYSLVKINVQHLTNEDCAQLNILQSRLLYDCYEAMKRKGVGLVIGGERIGVYNSLPQKIKSIVINVLGAQVEKVE